MMVAHKRRRALMFTTLTPLLWTLDLAALPALITRRGRMRSLRAADIVCALMTVAHERRRTLVIATLATLRRVLDLTALCALTL